MKLLKTFSLATATLLIFTLSSCNSCSSEKTTEQSADEVAVVEEPVANEVVTTEAPPSSEIISNVLQTLGLEQLDVTYEGVLPCADCPGIHTELTLASDLTYALKEEYQERDTLFTESGKLTQLEENILTLQNSETEVERYYKITSDGKLLMLGVDKSEPAAELYDQYLLTLKR